MISINELARNCTVQRPEQVYYCEDVFAVIVTYNPELGPLRDLLDALSRQVGGGVIVDNGSSVDIAEWVSHFSFENFSVLRLHKNLGIAAAQNLGIEAALQSEAIYVLLSDQDSMPADDMVYQLRLATQRLHAKGTQVAAVGPRYTDSRQNNPPPFIRIEGFRIKRQFATSPDSVVEVDYLIASGCLIPLTSITVVGGMSSSLFIDFVDIDWGLRAKHAGLQSYGVFAARMSHSLGDSPIAFMGRNYPAHNPLRHYYLARNSVWVCKQAYAPWNWKLSECYRMCLRIIFYSVFARPRHKHFAMMMRGLAHGLMSRLGPADRGRSS